VLEFLVGLQSGIHTSLSDDIAAFALTRDWLALLAVLPLGMLFGSIHALTPGHSKAVLATYIVGSGMSPWKAMGTAFALSVTHIGSAVLLALVGSALVTRTIVGAGQAPALEMASRLLLVAIGLWLVASAIWHRPHLHGEGVAAGFFAGLVPCPLTLFIMVFAVSHGVPEAGLVFAVAMLVGVGGILVIVALVSAFASHAILKMLDLHGQSVQRFARMLHILAGLTLVALAATELLA
jgi:ABC-type nickel/cobalt efflux system permease component RcnA